MKYCDKCKVSIVGDRKSCPLCQGPVRKISDDDREIFPLLATVYHQYHLFFRILIFCSAVVGVVSLLVNLVFFPKSGMWSIFVVLGIACLWFNLAFAVRKRRNLLKSITYQVVTISVTCLLWDLVTGWHGWSIDYVFPILLSVSIVTMTIITNVMKQYIEDQIVYFCISSAFGLIPIILFITGSLQVVVPSAICMALCVIAFVGMLVFQGEELKHELKRRMHF